MNIKKRSLINLIFTTVTFVLASCGNPSGNELKWIPENGVPVVETTTESIKDIDFVNREVKYREYTSADIAKAMIDKSSTSYVDMLWQNQMLAGTINLSEEVLNDNMLTYYFSTSEGDDKNSGLSEDKPKYSLESFSGKDGINILLKNGDTFDLSNTFSVGNGVRIGTYGGGLSRPVLNFRRKWDVTWEKTEIQNVWKASLLTDDNSLANDQISKEINIGNIWIDDECTFNRITKVSEGSSLKDIFSVNDTNSFYVDTEELYIFVSSKKDLNHSEISFASCKSGLEILNKNDIYVNGIEIVGAGAHGISIVNSADINLSYNYIHHIGGSLLKNTGNRYGNAIEIWDSGSRINVSNNIAEWIFDTAFTNQGSTSGLIQQNISFVNNISRFSFWGIECWGDDKNADGFQNIEYQDNIVMFICDVTNPTKKAYSNISVQLLDENGMTYTSDSPYITYRSGDYPLNQMSALNISKANKKSTYTISGNICWETGRLFTKLGGTYRNGDNYTFVNNTFFAIIPSEEVLVFRYDDESGNRVYVKDFWIDGNTSAVSIGEDSTMTSTALKTLENHISKKLLFVE